MSYDLSIYLPVQPGVKLGQINDDSELQAFGTPEEVVALIRKRFPSFQPDAEANWNYFCADISIEDSPDDGGRVEMSLQGGDDGLVRLITISRASEFFTQTLREIFLGEVFDYQAGEDDDLLDEEF